MKQFFIFLIILILSTCPVVSFGQNQTVQTASIIQYKKVLLKEKRQQVLIYNALNLTQEQIDKKECLQNETNQILEQKFDELINQTYKLNELQEANCDKNDILKQKKVVNNIKKDIECINKNEDKKFKKFLTRDQKSKYALIKKLENRDQKKENSKTDYYKSNPGLQPFGNI